MKVFAVILLLVGLGAAGIGVMHYVSYTNERDIALSHLSTSKKLAEQAVAKQNSVEGIKLAEDADTYYRYYRDVMGTAVWRKGYVTMDAIISGVALLLSVTLFFFAARRRRASYASIANSSAY